MDISSRILVVGHNDIIDNSLVQYFKASGFVAAVSSAAAGLNVLDQQAVRKYFADQKPEYVFLSSVRSGGIEANQKFSAEFIYENLECQNNIIHSAYTSGVKKLMFFSGSCAYPREGPQPIKEEHLLTGPLEKTSEAYSVAKIAGIAMCQAYRKQYGFNAIVGVPATLYGPGSDTDMTTAHVMGALIGKFHKAKQNNDSKVTVWGSGIARREFLYIDDFVDACVFLMDHYDAGELINIGCGYDVSIKELARMIQRITGFQGETHFDTEKPEGALKKLMDNTRLSQLGWTAKTALEEGIRKTYIWYRDYAKTLV